MRYLCILHQRIFISAANIVYIPPLKIPKRIVCRQTQIQMNGQRKYKVTIRVVDHPPRSTASTQNRLSVERKEQKAEPSQDKTISSGIKSVYKSSVSLQVTEKRSHSCVRNTAGSASTNGFEQRKGYASADSHDRVPNEDMLDSEFYECTKPLLKTDKTASLNINKLTRNDAIDEEEQEQPSDINNIASSRCIEPVKFITTKELRPQTFSSADFKAKYGVCKPKNGFTRHLPILVLNSANMEEGSHGQNISLGNGIQDDFLPDLDALRASEDRPPLNREGSACSSDSIITEIEELTDDEGEPKGCSDVVDCGSQEAGAKANNWKKIRGMIHWAPFAKSIKKKVPWVQLAGHQGNFKAGEQGTILKKTNDIEKGCLVKLMKDVLRPYAPEFKREVFKNEESYLVLQDLLIGFESPSVMDCKMGVRTFLEDELEQARKNPKLRKDLYEKMIDVDPNAPTEEERKVGGISKPRYMKWREELSSSASLGFRIEGIKKASEKPNKDFKTTRSREDLCEKFRHFINNDPSIKVKYLQRLKAIRGVLESSPFFRTHEVIGSSLLFVHDAQLNVNVWMIDFAKTMPVEDGIELTHRAIWQEGNHEDGYLFGLDNMISIWSDV